MTPQAPLTSIPQDIVCAADYERRARAHLDEMAWTYLNCGAGDEWTLQANRTAFQGLTLRNRVLADVSGGHTHCTLLGHALAHPFLLAPVAYQRMFHPDGEVAAAQGAAVMDSPLVLSSLASTPVETVAAHAGPLWMQLYLHRERAQTLALARRAQDAGCTALVVTVDAPLAGIRNREQRIGFQVPPHAQAVHVPATALTLPALTAGQSVVFDGLMQGAPTWQDIEWLVGASELPVLLKGILTADDALRAEQTGAAGLIVSNHGGRILDTVPATLTVLPEIAAAVGDRLALLLDGGVRRGSDAFKAIALGASAVLVGRPYVHALATAGALGVAHLLRTLREELEITMALCGCRTLADIQATSVRTLP